MNNSSLRLLRKIHEDPYMIYRNNDNFKCHISIFKSWKNEVLKKHPEYKYLDKENDDYLYDRLFTWDKFEQYAQYVDEIGEEDTYFSINSFFTYQRKEKNIRHLNAFAIDYDFYKLDVFSNLDPYEMYKTNIEPTLPFQPTAVIDSGRGLYVLYCFHHAPIKCLPLYKAIYRELIKSQIEFGADSQASLSTQLIRLPGSINSRSLKEVKILEFNDTQYRLDDLATILPFKKSEMSKKKKKANKKTKFQNNKDFFTAYISDLERLIQLRNGQMNGFREYAIYQIHEKGNFEGIAKKEIIQEAHRINGLFSEPLSNYAVEKQCACPKGYKFTSRKEKVIANLGVTENEQKSLKYLKGYKVSSNQKKRQKNTVALTGRTIKQQTIYNRRKQVVKWIKEKRKSIYSLYKKTYKRSEKSFKRDLAFIRDHSSLFNLQNKNEYLAKTNKSCKADVLKKRHKTLPDKSVLDNDRCVVVQRE